jgi:small subunit ribosomal protein S14
MATIRMIMREKVRQELSGRSRVAREALKEIIKDQNVEYDEKIQAVIKLNKQERDKSPCRSKSRCCSCGRSRSIYKKFRLCRLCLRKAFTFGLVPGLRKASW